MSGAEAVAAIGLISSVITIFETSRDLYDAATSAGGLPEAFRTVSLNIPLVLNILRDCKKIQDQADQEYVKSTELARRREIEESRKAAEPILLACQENAQRLKNIFEKVVPGEGATSLTRYRKAVHAVVPGKKRKVEDLMKDILQKLQMLHTSQFFKIEVEERSAVLDGAIKQLTQVPSSLPEDDGEIGESRSRVMNVNGDFGTQYNYNQSGGANNRQYIATTQHFQE